MKPRPAMLGLWVALLSLSGCTVWREKPVVNHWSETTGGESLERSFWTDIKAQNSNELERHIAGNYIAETDVGKLDRAASLAKLQQLKIESYSLSDFQIELNASTLVVTYTASVRGSFDNQPIPAAPLRIMGVWQHQKSGWIAIAHFIAT